MYCALREGPMFEQFGAISCAVRACLSLSLSLRLSFAMSAAWMMLCPATADAQVRGVRPPDVPGWFGIFNAPMPPCGEHSFGLYCYIGASGQEAKHASASRGGWSLSAP